ncbi:discoidin domain-containing protein [Kitasatospora sp. NBC_00240]|uniref:discoidin domain-containing protein n=1 Tax=Kitasatospora sp. NBC_00240 TaxID=2903567 RepID=UPI00225C2B36|nr:discoidin domain-containing protein [Kitasatospora sp. NBC_00240]MCX5216028.1 discoidin domain-containing protein [Kitasatospora sp. NBC_00240]
MTGIWTTETGNTVTVTNPGARSTNPGTVISPVQVSATDSAAGQTLTYTATGLPAGLTINSATGQITGTPVSVGSASVTVTATDTTGASGFATFTWTVTGSDLALGRPTTAFSTEAGTLGATLATDGNPATRWASAYSDPQWLQVDLGSTKSVKEVKLTWEAAYGKAYQIQTSNDGSTWTTIFSTTTGDGGTDDLTGLTGSGRYIRMNGTTRGTSYGYSLWSFQVYSW